MSIKRISFRIPGDPEGKARPRVTFSGGRAHAFTPSKTRRYEDRVCMCAKKALDFYDVTQATDQPCRVEIVARFEYPKKYLNFTPEGAEIKSFRPGTKAWQELQDLKYGRKLPAKPDADNIAKAVLDALNGLVFTDDAQVFSLNVTKRWRDPETERFPGVDVAIEWEEQ